MKTRVIEIALASFLLIASAFGDVVSQLSGLGPATQVTLGNSAQAVTFTGTTTGADVTFTTLSGPGLFGSDFGHYTMTLTSGPIPLAPSSPPIPSLYDVIPGAPWMSSSVGQVSEAEPSPRL